MKKDTKLEKTKHDRRNDESPLKMSYISNHQSAPLFHASSSFVLFHLILHYFLCFRPTFNSLKMSFRSNHLSAPSIPCLISFCLFFLHQYTYLILHFCLLSLSSSHSPLLSLVSLIISFSTYVSFLSNHLTLLICLLSLESS